MQPDSEPNKGPEGCQTKGTSRVKTREEGTGKNAKDPGVSISLSVIDTKITSFCHSRRLSSTLVIEDLNRESRVFLFCPSIHANPPGTKTLDPRLKMSRMTEGGKENTRLWILDQSLSPDQVLGRLLTRSRIGGGGDGIEKTRHHYCPVNCGINSIV